MNVSTSLVLVEISYTKRLQELELERIDLDQQYDNIEQFIKHTLFNLTAKISRQVSVVEEVANEILLLAAKLYEQTGDESYLNDLGHGKKPEPITETITTKTVALCKKLWVRIANYTHPDRVNNPYLIEFFNTAQIMYKSNDLAGLTYVLEKILEYKKARTVDDRKLIIKHQAERLEALLKIIKEKKERLANRMTMLDYMISNIYSSGQEEQAIHMYLKQLLDRHNRNLLKRDVLRQRLKDKNKQG